jgi:hypothetical protein
VTLLLQQRSDVKPMILSNEHGARAYSPEEAEALAESGFEKCYRPGCNFFISPEAQQEIQSHPDAGYYTCPKCKTSWDTMAHLPWHGAPEDFLEPFSAGGGTRIGLNMEEQAQIGEDLIQEHGLPGYGPIIWWHPGGAGSPSPLDGTTKEWGIEVKTLSFDTMHHRFIPGSTVDRSAKNKAAEDMGLRGVLGVLVMLNFRTSMASVYVREMPLEPWQTSMGLTLKGVATFRTNSGQRLLENIPFVNPFMSPHNKAPHPPVQRPEEEIPF